MAISLKIADELKNRVQQIAHLQIAHLQKRSSHWIMCEAIRKYVEREESQESFKQEALSSWAQFQETGQHLTVKEVQGWLSTWGNDDEIAMPTCHE